MNFCNRERKPGSNLNSVLWELEYYKGVGYGSAMRMATAVVYLAYLGLSSFYISTVSMIVGICW